LQHHRQHSGFLQVKQGPGSGQCHASAAPGSHRTLRRRLARRRAANIRREAQEDEDYNFGSVSDSDGIESEEEETAADIEAPAELVGRLSLALPPMQSDLGRWAARMAKAAEWMQEQRRSHDLPEFLLPMVTP